jgi:hypothetical protein
MSGTSCFTASLAALLIALVAGPAAAEDCEPDGSYAVRVRYALATDGLPPAGIVVAVRYPTGKLSIPGRGPEAGKAAVRGLPQHAAAASDDRDGEFRQVVALPGDLPEKQLFEVGFARCAGAAPPEPAELSCEVIEASDSKTNQIGHVRCVVEPSSGGASSPRT